MMRERGTGKDGVDNGSLRRISLVKTLNRDFSVGDFWARIADSISDKTDDGERVDV